MKRNGKYSISKSTFVIMSILTVICLLGYCLCSYFINSDYIQIVNQQNKQEIDISVLETIRDIILVILSICGTNLILNALIEVKSQNAFLEEIISNDVISAPEFYNHMNDENKTKIYNALEKSLFFDYIVVHDMFRKVKDKLNSTIDAYYFEKCNYVISCNVYDKYIEKEITKSVTIKSYENTYTIEEFSVGNFSSRKIDGFDEFELLSLEIDGEKIDLEKDVLKKVDKISNLDEQNKYDLSLKYVYKLPLRIDSEVGKSIVVKCITRTPQDDKVSTFRVTKPCRSFNLKYDIRQHEKYRLAVDAFGFLDDADDSTNNSSNSNINITFNDWIFKYDGVVVSILDKYN